MIHYWREYLRYLYYKNNDILYSVCATIFVQISVTDKILWAVFFLIFWSKWVTIQFSLATGQRLNNIIRQSFPKLSKFFFSSWIILFQKNSYFEKNLESYLYYLQINFKHKIPLSSTYIIQFYKGDSPLGRKGKRVHSCKIMMNETL